MEEFSQKCLIHASPAFAKLIFVYGTLYESFKNVESS